MRQDYAKELADLEREEAEAKAAAEADAAEAAAEGDELRGQSDFITGTPYQPHATVAARQSAFTYV